MRRLLVKENNVRRGHSLIDNKSSLSYLAHSRDLGSVKNKANSEESRDGGKHKISAMRDAYISLPSSIRAMSRDQASLLCNRKFPSVVQLKIILCDDFQADGKF